MVADGYQVFDADADVARWADAALTVAKSLDTSVRRHGSTWFVGVDALPNETDGSISGVPLNGPWGLNHSAWHPAQVSIIYPNYPRQDANESDAAHRFRIKRDAAHMDGLLPEGPQKRRYLREPHTFILGIALTDAVVSPLVVWPRSHDIMRRTLAQAFAGASDWGRVDVTDIYQAARREVFNTCERVEVPMTRGQSVLLHRHLIHGVAPWVGDGPSEGRMVAYFRPQGAMADWL